MNQPRLVQCLGLGKLPLGKVVDVHDVDKLSDPTPHIEDQVGKRGYKVLDSKTTLVCSKSSLSGLRVKEMHTSTTEKALAGHTKK